MNSKFIKATLKDKEFQDLIKQKSDIQLKEMVEGRYYTEEIDKKIKERGDLLRSNFIQ